MFEKLLHTNIPKEDLLQANVVTKQAWRQNSFLSVINSMAGGLFGAVKGAFTMSIWYFIKSSKSQGELIIAIAVAPITIPFSIVKGLFFGFFTGIYIGLKGGIMSDNEKKTPIHNFFDYLTIRDALEYVSRTEHSCGAINNYLACKYHGFTSPLVPDPKYDVLLIQDLLERDEHKEIVKGVMRKICKDRDAQKYLTYKPNLQFLPINDDGLMTYLLRNRVDSRVEKFIKIIESESNKVQRVLIPFLAAKHAPDPDNQPCAAQEWFNNPLFDRNNLKQIVGFLGGDPKKKSLDYIAEDSQPVLSVSIV